MKTIVVGAGAAGLWAALGAAERGPVAIVAPDPEASSSTALAQGGIAAAAAPGDSPEAHAEDTIASGGGLCDPDAVRILTSEAPGVIAELRRRGMVFDGGGQPTLEGGHRARRVLHAGGDATGRALLRALLACVQEDRRIRWWPSRVGSLLVEGGRAIGVQVPGEELRADRMIVATGGATGIFGRRTGPERATGQGMVLGWRAGAALADLEFVQFHPTALDVPGRPAWLLTEALRGEGARLVDGDGRPFAGRFDPRAELAPRDVVARAIATVRAETGRAFLDATAIPAVRERFPTVAASCAAAGLDLDADLIPVAPAAHYFTGGLLTDGWGRTTVPGLFACGEVACTGVHGANRLASNSLLEALVFGRRCAVADDALTPLRPMVPREPLGAEPGTAALPTVRDLADRFLGVSREGSELHAVVEELTASNDPSGDEGATLIAWLVAAAALRRAESRGGHFRRDVPEPRDEWRLRQVVVRHGWTTLGPSMARVEDVA